MNNVLELPVTVATIESTQHSLSTEWLYALLDSQSGLVMVYRPIHLEEALHDQPIQIEIIYCNKGSAGLASFCHELLAEERQPAPATAFSEPYQQCP